MRRKRFSVDRILAVLRQAEMGGASGSADPSGGDHRRDSESLEEALEGAGRRTRCANSSNRRTRMAGGRSWWPN